MLCGNTQPVEILLFPPRPKEQQKNGGRGRPRQADSVGSGALRAAAAAARGRQTLQKGRHSVCPANLHRPSALQTSHAARDISYNPEQHDRMKHVERRHFFVRDMVEKGEIEVPFVPTAANPADFFTKPMHNRTPRSSSAFDALS